MGYSPKSRNLPVSSRRVSAPDILRPARPIQSPVSRYRPWIAATSRQPVTPFRPPLASSQMTLSQRGSRGVMAPNQALLSGGQLVVAALRAHGVDMAFSVAGESYLEVLDA